jgi:O-antigen ligase
MKNWLIQFSMNKRVIRTIFIVLLTIQNTLGIVNTFSTMLPIPPRTSIGVMTGIAILLVGVSAWIYKKRLGVFNKSIQLVDFLLLLYVCFQAVSLLISPTIYQLTSFRILLLATVQYGLTRFTVFSSKEKKIILIGLGATALAVSLASVFQVFFRDTAIALARKLLFGDAAYGVVWELLRGRVPHLGNLTIAFPFFFGSLLFIRRSSLMSRCFVAIGTLLVFFAFFVSNFRWITLSFVFCTGEIILLLLKFRHIKISNVAGQATILLIALTGGLYFASTVSHYNLIDRLLIKDFDRDVTISIGRLYLYQQAADVFMVSPVIGVGFGNYSYLVEPIIGVDYQNIIGSLYSETDKQPISSHNELLTILAEGGFVSFFLFIWINILIFKLLIRQVWTGPVGNQKERNLFLIMFLVSLTAYYLYGMFENTAPNNFIVIFFIYAASVTWSKSDSVMSNFQKRK